MGYSSHTISVQDEIERHINHMQGITGNKLKSIIVGKRLDVILRWEISSARGKDFTCLKLTQFKGLSYQVTKENNMDFMLSW